MITVVLPHYNHRAYLMESVQSILDQTYENWEMIILNDDPNCNLNTYEYLDKRIIVIQDGERKGQAARLNEGIQYAKGEFIAFHDADDYSIPDRFRISLKWIDGYDVVYGDGIVLLRDGIKKYIQSPDPSINVLKSYQGIGVFASTMIRTDFAKKVPFDPDIGYGNDSIWWISVMGNNGNARRIPLPLYYYRNYTSHFRVNSFNKFQTIISRIHKKKIDKELKERAYIELAKYNFI